MKFRKFANPPNRTYFTPGDWNMIDDRFGIKIKASDTTRQWDGFRTKAAERRHEQDFIRSVNERIRSPWNRPEATDTFVNDAPVVDLRVTGAGRARVTSSGESRVVSQ